MKSKYTDFRVVTDGNRFKIQALRLMRFLCWTWERWVDFGRMIPCTDVWVVTYYDTEGEALERCAQVRAHHEAQHEWRALAAKS